MLKLSILGVIIVGVFGIYYFRYDKPSITKINKLEVATMTIRNKAIAVEVADSLVTRKQGLSGRASLEENQGMLFVYGEPGNYSFWMKDMNFAIDIIWISEDYKIIDITKNILPNTFPQAFQPSSPAKFVLEVNASWVDRNFIRIGDLVSF